MSTFPPPPPVPADLHATVPAAESGAEQEMLRELEGVKWGRVNRMPVIESGE